MHHGCNRQETKLSVFCSMMIMLCLVGWETVGTERLRAHMAFYVPALNAQTYTKYSCLWKHIPLSRDIEIVELMLP